MIVINFRDPRPLHAQITESFQRLILSGAIAPDERIPSVRELSSELAINPNTIQRAYKTLESDGFIYTVQGRGSFASPTVLLRKANETAFRENYVKAAAALRGIGFSREELIELLDKEVLNLD